MRVATGPVASLAGAALEEERVGKSELSAAAAGTKGATGKGGVGGVDKGGDEGWEESTDAAD